MQSFNNLTACDIQEGTTRSSRTVSLNWAGIFNGGHWSCLDISTDQASVELYLEVVNLHPKKNITRILFAKKEDPNPIVIGEYAL